MKKLLDHALLNCRESAQKEANNRVKNTDILESIALLFGIENNITRIEVYDNSHIMGKFAVGAMIVAGPEGFIKNEYRKYTISTVCNVSGGDDYAMMREVLRRRIKKFQEYPDKIPSLIILDGGKGHLNAALQVFSEENVDIPLVCMSKGEKRNSGNENFHMKNKTSFTLDNNAKEMKYLQILRDEVHNFAITSHRRKRTKAIYQSKIDDIPAIGPARKKALLNYFGSFDAIKNASTQDLQKVDGISANIALKIKEYMDLN
ncbi:MAG: helix-hairpin-helix domain-containing protein [Rickettsiaceae bacterium]|nr:helix-hairpin-helix domain-containing protein [Rickettsiaceae bacterium]